MHLMIEGQIARGMKLSHEDNDHLLFGIHGKCSVEEAAPTEFARCAQFRERGFHAVNAESLTTPAVVKSFFELF
jgi:hypothetical protein